MLRTVSCWTRTAPRVLVTSRAATRLISTNPTLALFRPLAVAQSLLPSTSASLQQKPITIRSFSHKPPLTLKTTEERIMLVLSLYDKIDPKKLTMDSRFIEDLGLDSLDFVEVIMEMEHEFNFEIPDGDADRMKTPRDLFQYICDKEDVYE